MKTKIKLSIIVLAGIIVAALAVACSPAEFKMKGATLVKYNGNEASVTIPSSVTVIGERAFFLCESLTSVTIPPSVTVIETDAFNSCVNLTRVTFQPPSSVTRIGDGAFAASSLTSIVIPASVTEIGSQAFIFCYSLTNVTLSHDTRVGYKTFDEGAQIHYRDGPPDQTAPAAQTQTSEEPDFFFDFVEQKDTPFIILNIEDSGDSFLFRAYKPYMNITIISIGIDDEGNLFQDEGLYIDERTQFAFRVDASKTIRGISFTDEKRNRRFFYIAYDGMDGSVSLREFQNITSLGDFNVEIISVRGLGLELANGIRITGYTGSQQDLIIPPQIHGLYITHIGDRAFYEKGLTGVTIPDKVIAIGEAAFAGNQLTGVTIPDKVMVIGYSAFYFNQLTTLTIPDSVIEISGQAFAGNQLTGVVIPDSVTSIGAEAFAGNPLNGNVTVPDNIEIGWHAFENEYIGK